MVVFYHTLVDPGTVIKVHAHNQADQRQDVVGGGDTRTSPITATRRLTPPHSCLPHALERPPERSSSCSAECILSHLYVHAKYFPLTCPCKIFSTYRCMLLYVRTWDSKIEIIQLNRNQEGKKRA